VHQRAILISLVVRWRAIDAVRHALEEEFPGFPAISDGLIRYYRRRLEADLNAQAQITREQALRCGLANKAVRVQLLARMVEQWKRVPLVETTRVIDARGREQTVYRTREGVSREMRELLRQIAMELGQYAPAAPPSDPRGTSVDRDTSDEADETIRGTLEYLLRDLTERQNAA
jgi:hypothetical protein